MPIRYTSEFRNIEKVLYKIEIIDEDYSGLSTDFILYGEDGATIKYGKQGDRSYNLIKSSALNFEFAVNNSDDLSFIIDLSTSNEGRFKVKLYRDKTFTSGDEPDGTGYEFNWGGIILADMTSFKDDAFPFGCKITATDGLGLLSSIQFKQLDGTAFTGRHSVLKWIKDALSLTGVLSLWGNDDVFIQTYIKWFEVNNMTPEVDDPAELMYLYYNSFNEIGEDGELKCKTALQMLNIVCTLLQARLILVDGVWRLQQVESMELGLSLFNYKKDLTYIAVSGMGTNNFFDVTGETGSGKNTGFYQRRNSWARPLSDVKLTWEAGGENTNGNIYPLFYSGFIQAPSNPQNILGQIISSEDYIESFGPFFLPTALGWSQLGAPSPPQLGGFIDVNTGDYKLRVSVKINFHLIKKSNNVGGANTFFNSRYFRQNIKFRFKDEDNIQSNDRYVKINNGGFTNTDLSPLVLNGNDLPHGQQGAEQITSNSLDRVKYSSDFMSLSSADPVGSTYTSSVDAFFQTNVIPNSSTLEVLADDFADMKIVTAQGVETTMADNTIFGNFKLTIGVPEFVVQILKDGEIINNVTTSAYAVDTSNNLVQSGSLNQEMYFGDGPNGIGSKVIWIKTAAGTYVQSTLWNLNSDTEDKTIHKLAIENIIKFNRLHRSILNTNCIEKREQASTPYINQPNSTYRRIYNSRAGVLSFDNYAFNGGTYNLGMAQLVGEWAIFNFAPLTGMQIDDNDIPPEDENGGGEAFILSPPEVTTSAANVDSVTKINATDGILIGDGATTTISIEALDVDLKDNFLVYLMDLTGNKIQPLKLNGAAAKGATSLIVDSFTPRHNFSKGSYIVPSVRSAVEFGADDNLALGVTSTKVYIKSDQFKTWNSSSIQSYSRDNLGSIQPSSYASRTKVYASTFIPSGYKVTAFDVHSSQNRSIQGLTSRVTSDSITLIATGSANTLVPATWNAVDGDYFIITYEIGANTDEIYGATIDILKI
tara:strand:- start:5789 stop:8755 length:2967 start_codon:yes stop_codon:yes gene_type:complete